MKLSYVVTVVLLAASGTAGAQLAGGAPSDKDARQLQVPLYRDAESARNAGSVARTVVNRTADPAKPESVWENYQRVFMQISPTQPATAAPRPAPSTVPAPADAEIRQRANLLARSYESTNAGASPAADPGLVLTPTYKAPDRTEVVAILGDKTYKVCSGAVISPRVVLTAAHCVCQGVSQWVVAAPDAKDIPAIRNAVAVASTVLFQGQGPANESFSCGEFHAITNQARNSNDWAPLVAFYATRRDIAVLLLDRNLPSARVAENIGVARPAAFSTPGSKVTAFGFGVSQTTPGVADYGERAALDVVVNDCRVATDESKSSQCVAGQEIIGLSLTGDTCRGDSGGPIFAKDEDPAQRRVVGLTSRALAVGGACGKGAVYEIFDAVVLKWMDAVMMLNAPAPIASAATP